MALFLSGLGLAVPGLAPAQAQTLRRPAAAQYDVIALRVEFQPDTTRFTTGDGTFDGELYPDGLRPALDPLPHDAAYFDAHLAFLEAYVAQVSDGQTQVSTHLVPEVVRVSREMGAYSPTGFEADSDAERAKLVALVEEAWATASRESAFDMSGFDPARTAFLLFHAGVGRDVELLGTTLDKTPQDLPSIFFSERALNRLGTGPITFKGFPVRQTIVLPRTETRSAFNFIEDESFLFELSINGLLAASFFNVLGVPDLFNTETGEPAIGPFGLMDPLGLFAYAGLFPPEPSAWTKYFLGWMTPQDLTGDAEETVSLSAAGLLGASDAARASISSAEYFLIENRHRDPEGDGLVLQVWQRGELVEQRVQNGDDTFTRFDVEGFIGGVVVGVDQYDWALPGGVDEDGNDLNGGILVWHIDERRIAAGLETGRVNADPERRGVDLEEADSAQDLGFPPDNPFGPVADQGTPFDYFFRDNPITTITATGQELRFYENRFGPATIPDSDSNEGGPSFITLEDFSVPGPEMTFVYRRAAEAGISPLLAYPAFENPDAPPFVGGGFVSRLDGAQPELLLYTGEAEERGAVSTLEEATGHTTSVTIGDGSLALRPVVTSDGRHFSVTKRIDVPEDPLTLSLRTVDGSVTMATFQEPAYEVTDLKSPLVTLPQDGQQAFYIIAEVSQSAAGVVLEFVEDGTTTVLTLPDQPVLSLATDGAQPILIGPRQARVRGADEGWSYEITPGTEVGQAAFGRDRNGLVGVVPVIGADLLLLLRADQTVERLDVSRYTAFVEGAAGPLSAFPILVDLDEDGLLDVLTTYGKHLVAFSQNGALVRGFPFALEAPVTAQPLVVHGAEGQRMVVVASTNGHVYAYEVEQGGAVMPGFPLAVGATVEATPLVENQTLYAVSRDGSLRAWSLEQLSATWWGHLYGNAQHHSYVEETGAPGAPPAMSTSLIIDAETYNWPNPIRDGQTFLRCMTREDATVRITVIDAAGSLIDDIELELRGETPAEHLWRVQAASGLYYARVTATSRSGESATKLIKMAIIR